MENLHRDLSKEGKRGKEKEQGSEEQVSEDRQGDREPTKGYISERHLWRQTGRQRAEILHRDVSKEKEGMREKEEEQRS